MTDIIGSRVEPFSNGAEQYSWMANNCDKCKKSWIPGKRYSSCNINDALGEGYDVDFPISYYFRMGGKSGECQEKETE